MFLLIDNYDSFTYNLVQAFYALGKEPAVYKNDDPAILDLAAEGKISQVCISPGPGHPSRAGLCLEFLKRLDPFVPVLGICLGHQLLGLYGGAQVGIAPSINHGKQSDIAHDAKGIFKGVSNPLRVGRYHSLVVYPDERAQKVFAVTARGPEGEVMALQYKDRPWIGLQFHPESVLTPEGQKILENFFIEVENEKAAPVKMPEILECLAKKQDLNAEMAQAGFASLMDGELSQAQAGAFLLGLRIKGESPLELAHAIRAALARSVRVPGISGHCIDIVGTGGDGRHSFNCSTATSFVMAGMGYKVVKHGNRAVSSTCGAADAMEALGIPLEANPAKALDLLNKKGLAFLFAPYFHPAFKNIGPIRKELGVRTLFNILGPMINPARPSHLLMGVARPELVELVANTLVQMPLYRAAVVCGAGDYDEMTPMGPADIAIIQNGEIKRLHFDPADYGIKSCTPEDLKVQSKEDAVNTLRQILAGKGPKAMQDMVILNAALAVSLMEENISLDDAVKKAANAVRNGAGMKVLQDA